MDESRIVLERPVPWQRAIKRLLDMVGSAALLVLLSPVMILIALAVRITSPGPILYHWRVVGLNGRPFTGYKFRSMVRDADTLKEQLLLENEMRGPVFKIRADPRVTGLGRWLRRYSLDELPQLWSVLKGDMSLVGPRPVFPKEYQQFEPWQRRKLTVVPGLTCTWQVNGRNGVADFDDWVRMDLAYIDNWSIWLDLIILLKTVRAVLKGTGR
ncbi:MAG: sugar transferase [Chloroflexi bacterium]|nr:MAG: sugar transferase [Chloroflexota bacterium]